ncbi:MAG: PAS domain-containing protein [Sulfuricurvum sp.]|jgi:PAS domain S-box-containing protein
MLRELNEDDFIVSKTDLKGRIIYCNRVFMDLAQRSEEELLGKAHNIIRHPDMPKAIFKYLWSELPTKREVFAYVINRGKLGDDYWVYANFTASIDANEQIVDYYSVRRRPNPKALEVIVPLYAKMLEVERREGVDASMKILTDILEDKGANFNEYIIYLQNKP